MSTKLKNLTLLFAFTLLSPKAEEKIEVKAVNSNAEKRALRKFLDDAKNYVMDHGKNSAALSKAVLQYILSVNKAQNEKWFSPRIQFMLDINQQSYYKICYTNLYKNHHLDVNPFLGCLFPNPELNVNAKIDTEGKKNLKGLFETNAIKQVFDLLGKIDPNFNRNKNNFGQMEKSFNDYDFDKKSSKSSKRLYIGIGLVITVVIIAGITYYFYK